MKSMHDAAPLLILTSDLDDDIKKKLLSELEIWKRDKAPQFWLHRRARIAAIDTATTLVEGSVPYAEGAILQNTAAVLTQSQTQKKLNRYAAIVAIIAQHASHESAMSLAVLQSDEKTKATTSITSSETMPSTGGAMTTATEVSQMENGMSLERGDR
ncbi:hypothetical protein BGX26_008873 [Mortierella sp. AD094]|nr:hypothetical protein BGX26_008873 [Mortierella sp. AD094]